MDPVTLALLGLPQIFKIAQAGIQSEQANKLQLQDTTTPAEREALAMARQKANAQLPGYGTALNQIGGATNNTLAAGKRAGSSASSVLGLLTAADASQQQALAGLTTRSDTFHQQEQRELSTQLQQQSQRQQRDKDTLDRNKGALREASQRNLFGAVDGVSQVGAYATMKPDAAAPASLGVPGYGTLPVGAPGFAPEIPGRGRGGQGRLNYGVDDYYSGGY